MNYSKFVELTAQPVTYSLERDALGLASEVGEFAQELRRQYEGKVVDTSELVSELGDILWYLQSACNALEVSLEDIANNNVAKLCARKDLPYITEYEGL